MTDLILTVLIQGALIFDSIPERVWFKIRSPSIWWQYQLRWASSSINNKAYYPDSNGNQDFW